MPAAWPKSKPARVFFLVACPNANDALLLVPNAAVLLLNAGAGAALPKAGDGAVAAGAGGVLCPNWKLGVAFEAGAGAPNAGVEVGGGPKPGPVLEPVLKLFSLLPKVNGEDLALTLLLCVTVDDDDEPNVIFLGGSPVSEDSLFEPNENVGTATDLDSSLLTGGVNEKGGGAEADLVASLPKVKLLDEVVVSTVLGAKTSFAVVVSAVFGAKTRDDDDVVSAVLEPKTREDDDVASAVLEPKTNADVPDSFTFGAPNDVGIFDFPSSVCKVLLKMDGDLAALSLVLSFWQPNENVPAWPSLSLRTSATLPDFNSEAVLTSD